MGAFKPSINEVMDTFRTLFEKNGRGVSVTEVARYLIPHQAKRNYDSGNHIYNVVYSKTAILLNKGEIVKVGQFKVDKGMSIIYAPADAPLATAPPSPAPVPRVSYAQIKDMFLGMDVTRESDLRDRAKMTQLMRAINQMPGGDAMIHRGSDGLWTVEVSAPPNSFSIGAKALAGMFPSTLPASEEVAKPAEKGKQERKTPEMPSDEELDQVCAAIEILEWKNPGGSGILDIIGLVYPDLVNPAWKTCPAEYERIKTLLMSLRRAGRINMKMALGMKRRYGLYTLAKDLPTAEPHPTPENIVQPKYKGSYLNLAMEHIKLMETNQPKAEPQDLSVAALQANLGKTIEAVENIQETLPRTLAMLLDMEKDLARYAKVMVTLGTLRSQLGAHDE